MHRGQSQSCLFEPYWDVTNVSSTWAPCASQLWWSWKLYKEVIKFKINIDRLTIDRVYSLNIYNLKAVSYPLWWYAFFELSIWKAPQRQACLPVSFGAKSAEKGDKRRLLACYVNLPLLSYYFQHVYPCKLDWKLKSQHKWNAVMQPKTDRVDQ